jgi:hypothetical protein
MNAPGRTRAAVLCALLVAAATAASAREDQILILGNPAGAQTVARAGGATRAEYSYNDRGRGDHIVATWKLDAAGVPTEYTGSGNDYIKAAVTESFRLVGGKASWRNRAEQGDTAVTREAFYVPVNGPPEMLGVLARALLKAPEHRLALLPAGEATIEAVSPPPEGAAAGTIVPGKLADLILIDGDPSAQIADINKVTLVMKGGRIYDPAYRAGARHRAAQSQLSVHRRFMQEAL